MKVEMFPKLKKFLTRPGRAGAKSAEWNKESSGGPRNGSDQDDSLIFEETYRSRTSTVDENLMNQELHFIVDYLGYCQVSEVQSISLLLESVKRVKKGCTEPTRVDFLIKEGVLKISTVACHALILTVPLYIVALCAQESLRGFEKCFGVNITRKNAHLCYVFQAGSSLEASSVVRSVALSFKSLGKMLRDRKEKIRQIRRRKKTPLYHQNSVGSDWSSQSGYNDSNMDPWQAFDTWSRVSSTTSKGSEHPKQPISARPSLNTPTTKRSSTYHSFKHVEFTALSPVPSNNSSNENSVVNLTYTADQKRKNPTGEKRKGEFQVEVDIHQELNQKLGRVERLDDAILQETFDESREESFVQFDDPVSSLCVKDVADERLEMVLSAIQRGDLVTLGAYLDDGVEVDLADSTRRSLLFHAVNYGQIGAVQLLLDRGASVNWEGPNDMSPLHQSAANHDKSIAQILLARGANVRAKDCEFRTPLHLCAGHPSGTELSCILVEHGARICDNSIDGTRPLDLLPDLKELQSRLVQSVCEVFMSGDPSKLCCNSAASTHSFQSNHSVMSVASLVPHMGSLRNLYTQSPQLRHARIASRRFTANFDVGSFQWKKDAWWMMDDNGDCTIRKSDKGCRPAEDAAASFKTEEDACQTCNHCEQSESNGIRKSSFRQETHRIPPSQDPNYKTRITSCTTTPVRAHPSFCETVLVQDIVAQHQSDTAVVGSIDTWTKDNIGSLLFSSTPADTMVCDNATQLFLGDVMDSIPGTGTDSTDSGVQVPLKEESGNIAGLNQSILHHGKIFSDNIKGKNKVVDSVRFQDSAGPSREIDSCLGSPEGNTSYLTEEKECRERTRSNADSCYSSLSPYSREEDPILMALNSLVNLSFNPECQPSLLSYLCLPKASSQLSVFAQSSTSGQWIAEAVAVLIKNLASIEGPDSRRRAAEAGFIRTVLELAEAHEPVQTTCLEVLDKLLKDVKCEREYNSTMSNIPSGPLLNLLNHQNDPEVPAKDKTAENIDSIGRERNGLQSREPHFNHVKNDVPDAREPCKVHDVDAASSLCSCRQSCHDKLSPRLVATRLLASSSTHLKMQRELGTPRAITLLLDALGENNEEVAYNAAVTLANIAMYHGNHSLLSNCAAADELKKRIPRQSRAYYHVCRALVYLGEDDDHVDYLFDSDNEEPKPLYTEQSSNQEPYIKGGSLETLVRILTTDAMALWGGVPLLSPSPKNRARGGRSKGQKRKTKVNEQQVIEFFLATYSTYTNAVVLMRLLVHRFHDPKFDILFDDETGVFGDEEECLPPLHMALMRIWEAWLEKFPEDFRENPPLQVQLSHLINALANYGGPYLICANRLEDLLIHYQEVTSFTPDPEDHCHHDVLFRSCQQAVLCGSLPARIDDAIYLAGLQLYIEISSLGQQSTANKVFHTDNGLEKISTSRIKLCLNPTFHKVKNVYKRVRACCEQIARDEPSQRKAKHDYIDCCQGMVGYGCRFFNIKEFACCNKSHLSKRLVGVSPKEVVLLDGKTRNLLKKWDLNSLLGWKSEESNNSLLLLFSESSFQLVCDSKESLERLQDTVKQCIFERNCEGINQNDFLPWSKRSEEKCNWGSKAVEEEMKSRLENLSKTTRIFDKKDEWKSFSLLCRKSGDTEPRTRRHSSPSKSSMRRRQMRSPQMRSPHRRSIVNPTGTEAIHDGHDSEDDVYLPMMAYSVGTLEQRDLGTSFSRYNTSSMRKSPVTSGSTLGHQSVSYLENTIGHLGYETSHDNRGEIPRDDDVMIALRLKTCLCPPDAELAGLDRNNFTPLQLLQFPRELARQITLIDHELFRKITTEDILKRVCEGTAKKHKKGEENWEVTTVKKFSDRFNQLSSWVVSSLLKEESEQTIAEMVVQFIETAKQCLELRNYNAMMAIGVGALCSAPVRRLRKARELIPKWYLDQLHIMEVLMDSRENHKKYRESLKISPSPAVPYFGVYLKDLIYISEGNPDYLNGGLINLGKRRLLYAVLHQIRRFQVKSYNFEEVPEIQEYLLSTERYTEEELHRMSRKLDTSSRQTISEGSHEASMSMSAVSLA